MVLGERCDSLPTIQRFSLPVRFSSTAAYWPARPMRSRTACGLAPTSRPSTSARPPSRFRIVVRIRTAVVLPAPFGPSRPSTLPVGTKKSTPSSAVTEPKHFLSWSTRMASSISRHPRPIVEVCQVFMASTIEVLEGFTQTAYRGRVVSVHGASETALSELANDAWRRMTDLFLARKQQVMEIAAAHQLNPGAMNALLFLEPGQP